MFDYAKISCRERQLKITSVDWTEPYKTAVPFIHPCDKSNDLSIHVQRVVRGGEDGCEGFLGGVGVVGASYYRKHGYSK